MTHFVDTNTGYCKSCDKQEYNVFQVDSPSSLDLRALCATTKPMVITTQVIIFKNERQSGKIIKI